MRTFLFEFLFSAVLWGSLFTWWLWRWRGRVESGLARKLLCLPLAWIGLHTALAWYGFVLPPSGRLVDADNGAPIKNTRVTTSWVSYPMSLWNTICSGEQAHLSDENGEFAFRFAPMPTLLFGTFYRSQLIRAPGRVLEGRGAFPLMPLIGTVPISHFTPNARIMGDGPFWQCELVIGPGASSHLLPGEEHAFDVMYRDACVEKQAWTLTDVFIQEMMRYAFLKGRADPMGFLSRLPLPPFLRDELRRLQPVGCRPAGGLCASSINPNDRDQFCRYFTKLQAAVRDHL